MSAHTPGPWRTLGRTVHPDREGFDTLAVLAECKTRKLLPTITKAEAEANARLIAAAPTMHADLVTISRACRRLLTPEQCATLSAEEEAAFGRAEEAEARP